MAESKETHCTLIRGETMAASTSEVRCTTESFTGHAVVSVPKVQSTRKIKSQGVWGHTRREDRGRPREVLTHRHSEGRLQDTSLV